MSKDKVRPIIWASSIVVVFNFDETMLPPLFLFKQRTSFLCNWYCVSFSLLVMLSCCLDVIRDLLRILERWIEGIQLRRANNMAKGQNLRSRRIEMRSEWFIFKSISANGLLTLMARSNWSEKWYHCKINTIAIPKETSFIYHQEKITN